MDEQEDDAEESVATGTLEDISRDLHDGTGNVVPVDAFQLAAACGLELRAWMKSYGRCDVERGIIWYPAKVRHSRQHGVVAHELGHWSLYDRGMNHSNESAARYLAGAILLPAAPFLRDCHVVDWDLHQLQALHPNASAQMVVVRMTQVSPACAWVWDDGRVKKRYGKAADEDVEDIVDRVLAADSPLRDGDVRAWPVLERGHRRVVVVRVAA